MKICEKHWAMFRAAIETRGLAKLVAKDGRTAMDQMVADLQYGTLPENYDPLMSCNMMVTSRALEVGGLYMLSGDYCPVCEAMKHLDGEATETEWINGPADAALKYCQDHKLIQGVQ